MEYPLDLIPEVMTIVTESHNMLSQIIFNGILISLLCLSHLVGSEVWWFMTKSTNYHPVN